MLHKQGLTSRDELKINLVGGAGTAFASGAIIGIVFLFVQESLHQAQEEAAEVTRKAQARDTWLQSLALASELRGFDPGSHPVKGVVFSGKNLKNAMFLNKDLRGSYFNEAHLEDAVFQGADLTGANFIGANLARATFRGADLSRADLRAASLGRALELTHVRSLHKAKVSVNTCWPERFMKSSTFKKAEFEVTAAYVEGALKTGSGSEYPACGFPPSS